MAARVKIVGGVQVEILQSFRRPLPPLEEGKRERWEDYTKGATPTLSPEDADLFEAKGHARRTKATAAAEPPADEPASI